MNYVTLNTEIVIGPKPLNEVLKSDETAFVGKCGCGPEHSLYLITYGRIVLAENPNTTWDQSNCLVYIERYVNVEIKEVPK